MCVCVCVTSFCTGTGYSKSALPSERSKGLVKSSYRTTYLSYKIFVCDINMDLSLGYTVC